MTHAKAIALFIAAATFLPGLAVADVLEAEGAYEMTVTSSTDSVPDAFIFPDVSGINLGFVATSAPITVSGINIPAEISVSGTASPAFRINSGAWLTSPSLVNAGDVVRIRATAINSHSAVATTTVTIGGVSSTFSVISKAASSCEALGGTSIDGTCRFTSSTCPDGWTQDQSWGTYASTSCSYYPSKSRCTYTNPAYLFSGSSAWANINPASMITFTSGYLKPGCTVLANTYCTPTTSQIGCKPL